MKTRLIAVVIAVYSLLAAARVGSGSEETGEPSNRGVELLKQGKVDEALGHLLKAVEMDPQDQEARLNLAHAYERQGRVEEAIVQCQKAVELNPRNPVAHNNLGVLYDRKGLYDEAIREFETVLQIDSRSPSGLRNLETAKKNQAIIQEREKQITQAVKEAEVYPESPIAAYKLARLHAFSGKKDQALEWLARALQLGFNDFGYLKVDPALQGLRDDADYLWLLRGR